MDCANARIEISARLDDESDADRLRDLDAHLASCVACRAYADEAAALNRRTRLRAAEPVPDLTAGVLAAIGAESSNARVGSLRVGLVVVGILQVLLAVPAFVFGDDAGVPAHTARHLGSFAVALGIGFLVAAWRPQRVGGLLAMTVVLVGCLLASSVIDISVGDAQVGSEIAGHATELVGLGLLWMLARDTGQVARLRDLVRTRGPALS